MIIKIRKRDGRIVRFNPDKINNAIEKALIAVGRTHQKSDEVTNLVLENLDIIFKDKIPSVEDIQDEVEKALIKLNYPDVAKAYILYRDERTKIRESNTRLMKTFYDISINKEIENQLTPYNTIFKYGLEGVKEFNKIFVLNPKHNKAHEEGLIHIHNLEYLNSGINSSHIDLSKVISTNRLTLNKLDDYMNLILDLSINLKQEESLGPTFYKIDDDLESIVKYTFKDIYKEKFKEKIKSFNVEYKLDELNLKTLSLSNDNINKDLSINPLIKPHLKHFINIYDDAKKKLKDIMLNSFNSLFTNLKNLIKDPNYIVYFSLGTNLTYEGKLIQSLIIKSLNKEFIKYPIKIIYKLMDNINLLSNDPNYNIFVESINLVKHNLISYAFLNTSYNKDKIVSYNDKERIDNQNLLSKNLLTNSLINLSTTTINLVKIALLTKEYNKFLKHLDGVLDLVFEQLKERLLIISEQNEKTYPNLIKNNVWFNHLNEEIKNLIIKSSNLTIGLSGVDEVLNYFNQADGFDLINHIKTKIDNENEKTKLSYVLKETNDSKVNLRFIKTDKDKFGLIEKLTDKDNYNNIFRLDNNLEELLEKVNQIKKTFQLYNGGHSLNISINKESFNNKIISDLIEKINQLEIGLLNISII